MLYASEVAKNLDVYIKRSVYISYPMPRTIYSNVFSKYSSNDLWLFLNIVIFSMFFLTAYSSVNDVDISGNELDG